MSEVQIKIYTLQKFSNINHYLKRKVAGGQILLYIYTLNEYILHD